jgi:ribosomal protein S18 acetylase RimI-like enzyme
MATDPEPARPEEWPDAFRLLFRHIANDERQRRVNNALALLERAELKPEGIFVLREAGQVVGALTCLPLPGATALIWPPQCADGPEQTVQEDGLLQHAATWLRSRGVKLAQTLFPPDAVVGADALQRNGFVHLTHLWYLRHTLALPPHCLATPARLDFAAAGEAPAEFADTLFRSYAQTLDCPEINDVRTMPEILDGHRSQGLHDPRLWWLATRAGQPVGVVLVTVTPDAGEWDVTYVGIIPEMRRRGFGREVMLRVLCEARATDAPGVTLSVDGRNDPARTLYRNLGFEVFDRREVFLAIWR